MLFAIGDGFFFLLFLNLFCSIFFCPFSLYVASSVTIKNGRSGFDVCTPILDRWYKASFGYQMKCMS